MLEAAIFLAITLALIVGGLAIWHAVRGPAGRPGTTLLRFVAVSLVVSPIMLLAVWKLSNARTVQLFGEIVPRVETAQPLVALTFDDGPTARFTDEVLAILREEEVKATFFAVGQALERNPAEGQKIVAEGHELGNHSYSHTRLIHTSSSTIEEEIERTDELIRLCGQEGDIHFRPPNGKKLILLPYYLSRTGRKSIFWDVEAESYGEAAADADQIVERVLEGTRPGSIILLHVMYRSREESRKALPGIIQGLKEKGFRFVTVSELLAADQ
jgi:peptidoglycan/xylan/chitin deacetylase (PgdA/CDA1 family)